jgi:hypothetical protein
MTREKKRYTRATFQKAGSLSSWYEAQARDRMLQRRRGSNSLKLKIIQHNKELHMMRSPESPPLEIYRTPNSTLEVDDDDDSGLDVFCTPNADTTLMKMKSMNNLLDSVAMSGGNLSRMKSLGRLDETIQGDTPIDLIRLKRDFELKRFNDAKMQSMNNLNGRDVIDGNCGFSSRRHHSDNDDHPLNRLSLQPATKRRVGNTKYLASGESQDDSSYQLTKMRSLGTITDIVNNNMKSNDQMWKGNTMNGSAKKYDKSFVVPIRLEDRFQETNGNLCDKRDDEVFKMPQNPAMVPLRKEKSSSCIESLKNRGSSIYDRFR